MVLLAVAAASSTDAPADYARVLREVAHDIAVLKAEYPQLADFDPVASSNGAAGKITYQFHTHTPPKSGG